MEAVYPIRYRMMHSMSLRLDWQNWFYQLIRSFIVGGASAFSGGVAASALAPEKFQLGSKESWILICTIFFINGLLHLMAFLAQTPLPPPIEKTTANTVATMVGPSGDVSVVSSVTKTEKSVE